MSLNWRTFVVVAVCVCGGVVGGGCGGGDDPAGLSGDGGSAGGAGQAGASGSAGSSGQGGAGGSGGQAGESGSGGSSGAAGQAVDDAGVEPDANVINDAGIDAAPVLRELGADCETGQECASGQCVDGVCCQSACEGACMACAMEHTGTQSGTCAPIESGQDPDDECAMDQCMVGVCDGAGACVPVADGTECRPAMGVCDLAETCAGGVCPSDVVANAGTECRASRGACDAAETCDGSATDCPADLLASAQTVCREAVGVCDVAELCTGASDDCPSDVLTAPGTECRASAGICDVAESCTGVSVDCPVDARVPQGATCRTSQGPCDVPDVCDGANAACPSDAKSTAVCRAAAGTCDVAEICDGVNDVCPSNQYASAQSNVCGAQHCTGGSAACVACRNDGDCNEGERCASNNTCVVPKLVFSTSTTQNGNLGGLAGGDAICQTRADAAGLPGTYKAWLSSSTVSAASRLTHATVPYYMLNGTKIADDWNDLTDGTLDRNIIANELGVAMPNNRPYTGTNADGSIGGGTCNNWTTASSTVTALMGQSFSTISGWSATIYLSCDTLARLVCFQQ